MSDELVYQAQSLRPDAIRACLIQLSQEAAHSGFGLTAHLIAVAGDCLADEMKVLEGKTKQ